MADKDVTTKLILQGDASGLVAATNRAGQSVKELGSGTDKVTGLFARLGPAAVGAFAGFSAVAMVNQLHASGMAAERLRNSFEAATGSMRAGADAMGFVRMTSARLGLDLQSAADGYMKITAASKGTSMEGENTKQIFKAVAGASSSLGLSAEQTNGALLAISQMMSKGTVQAEELRGQLGERLPGAFQIAARAMGVTTMELGKMLEGGKVVAEDFLPKFAAELSNTFPPGEKAMSGLTAETNRLKTAWFELNATVMSSGGEGMFAGAIRGMRSLTEEAAAFVKTMGKTDSRFLAFLMPGVMYSASVASGAKDKYGKDPLPLNAFERNMAAPDFNNSGPSGGASYLLGSSANIMAPDRPILGPSEAELKEYNAAHKKHRSVATHLYTLENDLLLKNILKYDALKKEQYTDLREQLEAVTAGQQGSVNAFNLSAAQGGDLSTSRYNVTPLSNYRLLTNDQFSIPQSSKAFDHGEEAQAMSDRYEEVLMQQQELYASSPWAGLSAGIADYADSVKNLGDQFRDLSINTINQMSEALTTFVMTGKLSFSDLANSIITDLVRIQMRQAVSGIFSYLSSAVGSYFSPTVDGARASGGPVLGGSSYLVGEQGPEIFTPGAAGMITPNSALGSNINMTVNIVNQSGQQVKAKDGGSSFDGKSMVKTIILEAMDTDPSFRWAVRGGA